MSSKPRRGTDRIVKVVAGQVTVLEIALKPLMEPQRVVPPRRGDPRLRAAPPQQPPRPVVVHRPSPFYKRWWFWTGLAVAALTGVSAIYPGLEALSLEREWLDKKGIVENSADFKARGERFRLATDIVIGASALITVGVIIGAAVVGLDRKERPNSATVLPSCGPQGCGLYFTGRF